MRSDGDESHIGAGAGSHNTMEAVASYWAREKNRFRLSHLERKVFSWSVRDVFNRDLLRREVTTCIEHPFGGGFANVILHSYYACCRDLAAFDLLFEGFVFSFVLRQLAIPMLSCKLLAIELASASFFSAKLPCMLVSCIFLSKQSRSCFCASFLFPSIFCYQFFSLNLFALICFRLSFRLISSVKNKNYMGHKLW
jgi:hypothetical protein